MVLSISRHYPEFAQDGLENHSSQNSLILLMLSLGFKLYNLR
jgi:hypothetical protein